MAALESASVEAVVSCQADIKPAAAISTSVTTQLALIPLRSPSSKKRDLEIRKLPIVLGRTNLSQWWYQSCDCQHYYCRLHCRPVAQNIGSLSKVMIQIDSSGKVFVVGKNPHLVTITPERNDGILQANDIVSIGRRDREPWMRFQVIKNVNGQLSFPVVKSTRNGKRSNASSCQDESQRSLPKKKKLCLPATGSCNPIDNGNVNNITSSNLTSDVLRKMLREGQQQQQQQQQPEQKPRDQLTGSVLKEYPPLPPNKNSTASQKDPSRSRNSNLRNCSNQYDGQLPEWITMTKAKRNKGTRSTSSLSVPPHNTSTKQQQQHQDIVARLSMAAAAAAATAPNVATLHQTKTAAGTGSHKHHHHHHPDSDHNAIRKYRRRAVGSFSRDSKAMNGSSKGILSAEDRFHGSRSHYPQIHLMFQDYETSANLVMATQRQNSLDRVNRQPRTDNNFISNLGDGSPTNDCIGGDLPGSCATERNDEGAPEQIGLMSKKFAAALLGVAAPASAPSDSPRPPARVAEETGVLNEGAEDERHASLHDNDMTKCSFKSQQGQQEFDPSLEVTGGDRNDFATCSTTLAKSATEKKAATRGKGGSTQAEGEKTSELED
jgi:hypothetical protein